MQCQVVYIPDVLQPTGVFNRWKPPLLRLLKRICKQSKQSNTCTTITPYTSMSRPPFHFHSEEMCIEIYFTQRLNTWSGYLLWKLQWGSPTTQICLTLTKAHWMSWMLGRHLSRSDLTTSLRCGWLFVMAVKTLPQHKADIDDGIRDVFKKPCQQLNNS